MVYSSIVEKLFLKSVDVDFNRKAPLYWIFVSFVKDLRVLKMEQVNAEFLSPPLSLSIPLALATQAMRANMQGRGRRTARGG